MMLERSVHAESYDNKRRTMSKLPKNFAGVVGAVAVCVTSWPSPANALCANPVAEIVSAQGAIVLNTAPAGLADSICPGDVVKVGPRSRAAIVMLETDTVLRIDQDTELRMRGVSPKGASLLDLLRGALNLLTPAPRSLEIKTPVVNAAVEGTEFYMRVDVDRAVISVFEGRVTASNKLGQVSLAGNESAVTAAGQAPRRQAVVRPRDAVQWALYYPPIGAGETASPATRRAAELLAVGRVDEAAGLLDDALRKDPNEVGALALQSIIAVAQNRNEQAQQLARDAVAANPESAVALIALSYAQQASLRLDLARESVEKVVELDENNALAWARLSELWLSEGDLGKALDAARNAVERDPDLARAQSVLGFAHLTRVDIDAAKTAFENAIQRNQADPLPRLGLGLARIRSGDLAAGRRDIEIAATLDPNNSLVRSYLGKAYFEEKRSPHDARQLATAKALDPNDPTPWFYDAIRLHAENQPIEALADLQASIDRNDNRAVYRSRPNLDSDRAVRGVTQARVYDDLGFQQLAVVESAKSLAFDPSNHSALRFLSDSFAARPRHEVARASALLQSQLLQPINTNPVQPQNAEIDLNIITGAGPAEAAFNEFTPMFERNGHRLILAPLVGNNDTLAGEAVLSGIINRFSYSVGYFHHESDGFRVNNDVEHDIANLFAQAALTDKLDIQFEYRERETDQGDLRLNFDPDDFSISDRRRVESNLWRAGLHFAPSPQSDVLVSFIQSDREESFDLIRPMVPTINDDLDTQGDDLQGQYLFRGDRYNINAGLGASDIDNDEREVVDLSPTFPGGFCPPAPPFFGDCTITTLTQATNEQRNAYLYVNVNQPADATWTVGASYDSVEQDFLDVAETSPKLGVQWNVTDKARLRAAYMETVKRALIAEQTLEPTQVAGFAQFFDDVNGTKSERYGVGLDVTVKQPQRRSPLSSGVYAGIELSKRELEVPDLEVTTRTVTVEDYDEEFHRAYIYWTPHWQSGHHERAGFRELLPRRRPGRRSVCRDRRHLCESGR